MYGITYLFSKEKQPPQLFTLSQLAKGTPYSAKYLGLLAGKGRFDAVKEGKTWKTTKKTIDSYIEQQRSRNHKKMIVA